MMFLEKPTDFDPRMETVSCFLERDGRFLLLHRCDHKSEGDTWGVPAGKMEQGEDILDATIRELYEETGVRAVSGELKYWGKVFVRYPEFDFVYHISSMRCPAEAAIRINPKEHKDLRWVTQEEALSMNLIRDFDTVIKLFYRP